jgi:hypothetical protein
MSPKSFKSMKKDRPSASIEEFAQPSNRRYWDDHSNQETETDALHKAVHLQAGGAESGKNGS